MSLYCSQGHENQTTNRFCFQCGEALWLPVGQIMETRYRILRHLASGGFGRTYLAEDLHRFNERCVLKEFAPQVTGTTQLQKAKELFEREASAIYKLNHPQLPGFREFFQATVGVGSACLFLAQDYIEGQTYADLLNTQGKLSETEVKELLNKILPVLSYIHSQGVIHRDISPDNIIRRNSDNLPVLIDFGGVKQVAVNAVSNLTQALKLPTLLGKEGYAPEEQMLQGKVFPNSDLYALAVTAVVLLTGKRPEDLYDKYKGTWYWEKEIKISSQLRSVLQKMLAYKPSDRYQSADEVLQVLQSGKKAATPAQSNVNPATPARSNVSQIATMIVSPANKAPAAANNTAPATQTAILPANNGFLTRWISRLAKTSLVAGVIGISVWAGYNWAIEAVKSIAIPKITIFPSSSPILSESDRIAKILERRKSLGISELNFNREVNKRFHAKHPELRGRQLTLNPQDAPLREEWYKIAEDVLDKGI